MAKYKTITSPKGTAIYPALETPDTKFADSKSPDGVFKTKLRVNAAEGAEYAKQIDAEIDACVAHHKAAGVKNVKRADPPYSIDEETGDYIFTYKVDAFITDKDSGEKRSRKPVLFNAEGQPVTGKLNIGGGSVLKIAACIYRWVKYTTKNGAGVTLQPVGVQVIDLKAFGGNRDAAAFGFGTEEGFAGNGAAVPAGDREEEDEAQDNEGSDGSAF